jgi:hypothetical protein
MLLQAQASVEPPLRTREMLRAGEAPRNVKHEALEGVVCIDRVIIKIYERYTTGRGPKWCSITHISRVKMEMTRTSG